MSEEQRNELGGVVSGEETGWPNKTNILGLGAFALVFGLSLAGLFVYLDAMLGMLKVIFQ
jgi:hypothetical protein